MSLKYEPSSELQISAGGWDESEHAGSVDGSSDQRTLLWAVRAEALQVRTEAPHSSKF